MSEEDFKINYTNYQPDLEEALRIRSIASDLYFSSPSDSVLKIDLEKQNKKFQCSVEVRSTYFREKAHVLGENPLQTLEAVSHQISSKIDQWKSRRFKDLAG